MVESRTGGHLSCVPPGKFALPPDGYGWNNWSRGLRVTHVWGFLGLRPSFPLWWPRLVQPVCDNVLTLFCRMSHLNQLVNVGVPPRPLPSISLCRFPSYFVGLLVWPRLPRAISSLLVLLGRPSNDVYCAPTAWSFVTNFQYQSIFWYW